MGHPARMRCHCHQQEEDRPDRCPNHLRFAALRSAPARLCDAAGSAPVAACAALSQSAGAGRGADAEQIAGLLLEMGVEYDTPRLHRKKYFGQLLQEKEAEIPASARRLLAFSREAV